MYSKQLFFILLITFMLFCIGLISCSTNFNIAYNDYNEIAKKYETNTSQNNTNEIKPNFSSNQTQKIDEFSHEKELFYLF